MLTFLLGNPDGGVKVDQDVADDDRNLEVVESSSSKAALERYGGGEDVRFGPTGGEELGEEGK